MFTAITPNPPGVVRLRVGGDLTKEDYSEILPLLQSAIEEHGKVHLLVETDDLDAIEPKAVWKELGFDAKHLGDIGRFALVGDAAWIDGVVTAARPFVGEARHFAEAEREAAHEWILGGR